jgi:hypothetical protein
MNLLKFIFVGALLAVTVSNSAKSAQPPQVFCDVRVKVIAALEKLYAEQPVSMGLTNSGSMIEVFKSSNGSWSIVATQPSGLTCLIAAGDHWENVAKRSAGLEM